MDFLGERLCKRTQQRVWGIFRIMFIYNYNVDLFCLRRSLMLTNLSELRCPRFTCGDVYVNEPFSLFSKLNECWHMNDGICMKWRENGTSHA